MADCQHLQQRESYIHGDEGNQFAVPCLTQIGEGAALNAWLAQLAQCPRMLPLEQKVVIVCNDRNLGMLRAWASEGARTVMGQAGFPLSNIVSNSASHPTQYRGVAGDVAAFMAWNDVHDDDVPDSLLLIDTEHMPHPGYPFTRIVEGASTRAQNALGIYSPACVEPYGMPEVVASVDLKEGEDKLFNPVVTGMQPGRQGDMLAAAPLVFLRASSVPLARAFCEEHPTAVLPDIAAHLASSGMPLYGMRLESAFGLATLGEVYRTEAFVSFWQIERRKTQLKAKIADTDSSLDLASLHSARDIAARLVHAEARQAELMGSGRQARDLEISTRRFDERWRDTVAARQVATGSAAGARPLPGRFTDSAKFAHNPRKQHPVYQTSNNVYGYKRVTQQEMPLTWAGTNGDFSKSFGDGYKYRFTGFNCSRTTSNVHRSLDG